MLTSLVKAQSYGFEIDTLTEGQGLEFRNGKLNKTESQSGSIEWVMEAIEANEVTQAFETDKGEEEMTYVEVKFRVTPQAYYRQGESVPSKSRIYTQRMQRVVFDTMMKKQKAKGNEVVQFMTNSLDRHEAFLACPLE